ncbi:MAG: tetratricopeptide repeat protein [Syntrophobacteraceae bacterium]
MKVFVWSIVCVCVVLAPCWTGAESAASLVNTGNAHYAAGEFDKALEAYEKALSEQPDAGEILFNKGNALFRKGEFDKAREAYRAAALHTKDPALEASAHYNLGNAVFEDGRKLLESDPQKAISQWGESVRHFHDALRIDPSHREAAQNMEMVRISMKDLADRLKKAEDAARDQQQRREELQRKLEEVVREQESELAQNEALQERVEQNPGEAVDEEARKLASDQDRTREKTDEVAERLRDAAANQQSQPGEQQTSPAQAAQEHLAKAREAQRSASDKLMQSDLEDARKDQAEALKWLEDALDASKSQQDAGREPSEPKAGDQEGEEKFGRTAKQQATPRDEPGAGEESQTGTTQGQHPNEERSVAAGKEGPLKGEEQKAGAVFSESPESILREEKDNRLQLHRAQQGGAKPVEKDW